MVRSFPPKSYFTEVNYLAHIYLSGNNDLVTIGNFMADGIKGKDFLFFQKDIQLGIILHRNIDTYTDAHPVVRKSTKRLHSNYGHYSGIIVDILYDHFLAKNWARYHHIPLAEYVRDFYKMLGENKNLLTPRIKKMIPFMVRENWLLSYADPEGIATVLRNMNRRTKFKSGMDKATNELELYYDDFEQEFSGFFRELKEFSALRLKEIPTELGNLS